MNTEDLEKLAIRLFTEEKWSCAEAVLLATTKFRGMESPMIPRIATPFRGGLCGTQQVCGAVTGGLMAIGLLLGRDSGSEDSKACVNAGKAFMKDVQDQYGSISCSNITECDFSDHEQHEAFLKSRRGEVCAPLVAFCCRWLSENVK